jgi:DNA-binding MarR family transcriptional regulator
MSRYFSNELLGLLQIEIAAVLTYTAAEARRLDLTISEIAALEHLHGAGELTPTQLSTRLAMSSGAMTAVIDRLERRGYVERQPNPRDRRSSLVRPTHAGTQDAMRRWAPLAADLRAMTDNLSDEEREAVGRYLEALTTTILRYAHAQGDGLP